MTANANLELTDVDRAAIKSILEAERAAGNPNPLLPADVDIDGDGIVDSFGLNAFGEVVVVSGVNLEETLYVSDGDDIRNPGAEDG